MIYAAKIAPKVRLTHTYHIYKVIENYRKDWDELDFSEVLEVKKKFVTDVDKNNIYAEAKMNILQTVDEDMR